MSKKHLANTKEEPVGTAEARNQGIRFGQKRFLAKFRSKDQVPSAEAFDDFVVGGLLVHRRGLGKEVRTSTIITDQAQANL